MRVRDLGHEDMSAAQRRVADEAVAGKRGRVPAPLRAWIHSPEMAARAQRLGEFLRYETVLGPRLSELAILVTARYWTAHYEWEVHKREALKAGLESAIIAAIAGRRAPPITDGKTQVVYDYAEALHRERNIPDSLHARAIGELGEQGVVELVGLLGYYTLVSMTLNAFAIGEPSGAVDLEP